MIVKSYKICFISNVMDGTLEDFIYESDDKNSSYTDYDFYDEETMDQDVTEHFGDSVIDSEFVDAPSDGDDLEII